MEQFKNLVVICQYQDGSYKCTLDIYDEWTKTWSNTLYVARSGDSAPANVWIIQQIATGAYDPISACPIPVPPQDSGSGSPTVI
jgi:hypothetical protein